MKRVVILFERGASVDEKIVDILGGALSEEGYSVYIDRHLRISIDWARTVDERIRTAEVVIVVFSGNSLKSEMLCYELEVLGDAKLRNHSLQVVSVPLDERAAAHGIGMGAYQTVPCQDDSHTGPLIADILSRLKEPPRASMSTILLDPSGGGLSSDSPFYIQRNSDLILLDLLKLQEPTILIKGARQSGKTSLIAQGMKFVRECKNRPLITDFQRLGASLHADETEFYRAVVNNLTRQLGAARPNADLWSWDAEFSPVSNLDEFVRSLVEHSDTPIAWFMDEADWLFATPFADSFFALVRAWHNSRALSDNPCWPGFSVVIAYATEAHLFIQDINQSPFNVGRRVDVQDFSLRQTEELNKRYGEPLRGIDQVSELHEMLDGQPFLTRTAYDYLLRTSGNLRALLASADSDDGPFADHLRRVLVSVTQLAPVRAAMDRVLRNEYVEANPDIYRLVAAGILTRNSSGNHVVRCRLYRRYLERHLK